MQEQCTTRILAIDGRSGSGKTTLGGEVAHRIGAQLVHTEDFYPGWDGLRDGSDYLAREVLAPVRAGRTVTVRKWDWTANFFNLGECVSPGLIVVEGCGSVSKLSQPLVDVSIWLEADAEFRRQRAIQREGYVSWWDAWREQEEAFYVQEDSKNLADLVLPADTDIDELLAKLVARGCQLPFQPQPNS